MAHRDFPLSPTPKFKMTSKSRVGSTDFNQEGQPFESSQLKQKTIAKTNSEGKEYIQKSKRIGFEIDLNGKKNNPTITKTKTNDSGKEIKRITKPVGMGRAERNVKRVVSARETKKREKY